MCLDLGFDVVDGVAALHLEGDRLPRQSLHEYLHRLSFSRFRRKTNGESESRGTGLLITMGNEIAIPLRN